MPKLGLFYPRFSDHAHRNTFRARHTASAATVEKSDICRPGSDCWDAKLTFFDPENRQARARSVYRFTVDVSDVIPVTVGEVRRFNVY